MIITVQGATTTDHAAGVARAYAGGGYHDWYLPSKDELNKLWISREAIGGFNYGAGYWSSSEYRQWFAWQQNFHSLGWQNPPDKTDAYAVRAVRAF